MTAGPSRASRRHDGGVQDDLFVVRTAENVGIGYAVAGMASRLLALLIDLAVQGAIILVGAILFAAFGAALGQDGTVVALVIGVFLPTFVLVGYFTVLEATSAGRTPGKAAMHLRVVAADGSAPSLAQALVRNIIRLVDMLLGVGIVAMFLDPSSRRLGDIAAGTLVVREERAHVVVTPAAPPPILRTPDAGPGIDGLSTLGTREYEAVRLFLARPGLEPAQRQQIAARMAATLLDRMQLPPAAPERMWPPELFLERLYLQLGERLAAR